MYLNQMKKLKKKLENLHTDKLINAIQTCEKHEREENIDKVIEETLEYFVEKYPENEKDINETIR